jgi:hypothetical protein
VTPIHENVVDGTVTAGADGAANEPIKAIDDNRPYSPLLDTPSFCTLVDGGPYVILRRRERTCRGYFLMLPLASNCLR